MSFSAVLQCSSRTEPEHPIDAVDHNAALGECVGAHHSGRHLLLPPHNDPHLQEPAELGQRVCAQGLHLQHPTIPAETRGAPALHPSRELGHRVCTQAAPPNHASHRHTPGIPALRPPPSPTLAPGFKIQSQGLHPGFAPAVAGGTPMVHHGDPAPMNRQKRCPSTQ